MRTARGFTMVELLVTMIVVAILAGTAVPSFKTMIDDNRRDSALYSLIGDLQFARSESIKRSSRLAVCAKAPGAVNLCNTSTTINWSQGWLVFTDGGTSSGQYEPATEELLRVGNSVGDSLNVSSRARVNTSAITESQANHVRFGPRGTSNWRGGGYLLVCEAETPDDSKAMAVNVTLSGDIRRARRDGSGNLITAFGTTPSCPTT